MRLRSRKNWNAWWDELNFLKSITLYTIVDSWLPRPLLFYVGATSLAKPERDQICSAAQMLVYFLACWNYWILIRRVCDLSVGAASLQPEMRTLPVQLQVSNFVYQLPGCSGGWVTTVGFGSRWWVKKSILEPVPELLSRWENWN